MADWGAYEVLTTTLLRSLVLHFPISHKDLTKILERSDGASVFSKRAIFRLVSNGGHIELFTTLCVSLLLRRDFRDGCRATV